VQLMKYRKLRIAFSVGCGIACLLLVVLGMRSRWWRDVVVTPRIIVYSTEGQLAIAALRRGANDRWEVNSMSVEQWHMINIDSTGAEKPGVSLSWGGMGGNTLVFFPHWLPFLVSAVCGALPWLRWRFSLRTLLIVMTLVAVALGTIIALSR
jgi:hypothetical protein